LKRLTPSRSLVASAAIIALIVLAAAVPFVAPADSRSETPSALASDTSDLAAASATAFGTPTDAALATPDPWPPRTAGPLPMPFIATPVPTRAPTAAPYRDTVANARAYVKNRIGVTQYNCIDYIWTRESRWNPLAANSNGAYGIPQAYPGSKMASFGSNWRTSALTQVKWGIWYVYDRYGSACNALTFFKSHGWY
jgi:hypothetical protein